VYNIIIPNLKKLLCSKTHLINDYNVSQEECLVYIILCFCAYRWVSTIPYIVLISYKWVIIICTYIIRAWYNIYYFVLIFFNELLFVIRRCLYLYIINYYNVVCAQYYVALIIIYYIPIYKSLVYIIIVNYHIYVYRLYYMYSSFWWLNRI